MGDIINLSDKVELQMQIDSGGCLFINRGRGLVTQYCPDSSASNQCGDWCPKFGVPDIGIDDEDNEVVCLELCTCEWIVPVDTFEDLRSSDR